MLRRRMVLAASVLAVMVLVASAAGLAAQGDAAARLADLIETDRDITTALVLSLAVRDVYAHQAHTIILNDGSHLDHYAASVVEANNLLLALDGFLASAAETGEHGRGDEHAIAALRVDIAALDRDFRERVVPAIGGPRELLLAPHEAVLSTIDRITHTVDALTASLRARIERSRRAADSTAGVVRWALIALSSLAALLAIVIALKTARSLGPPLAALESGARRFASGELSHRIAVTGDDELAALGRQMNAMAADLSAHEKRLVEAETLAGVGRLAAGVAHEVNNPLTAILGFARLLERQPAAQADAARIAREAERCRDIVQGLLDLARPAQLRLSPVDVHALVELVTGVGEALEVAGYGPSTVTSTGQVELAIDVAKIRQVLWNLMKNAHEAGGPVTVEVRGDGDGAAIRVCDSGSGVAPGARLFEPFQSNKDGGTGLGLAVSRAIARRHGGDVVFDAPPVGACFALLLPRAPHLAERPSP